MQVNLLRQSNVAPKVSAWAYMHGQHDFNRHPLAPLDIETHANVPPGKRKTWATKSTKGFYIGTSMEHYRYYKAYCTETRAVQGSETMFFKHKFITAPTVTPQDAVIQAAKQLTDAPKGIVPPPFSKSGIDQIKKLSTIFRENDTTMDSPVIAPNEGAQQPTMRAPLEHAQQPRVHDDEPPPLLQYDDSDDESDDKDEPHKQEPQMIVTSKSPPTTSKLPDWMPDYQAMHRRQPAAPSFIEQDDDSNSSHPADDQPTSNTRFKRSTPTITQEALLACTQMSQTYLDPQQTAARKYALSLLCEMTGAVLDGTTGDLLEHRHLIRLPE